MRDKGVLRDFTSGRIGLIDSLMNGDWIGIMTEDTPVSWRKEEKCSRNFGIGGALDNSILKDKADGLRRFDHASESLVT
jgi:hypothetical protein